VDGEHGPARLEHAQVTQGLSPGVSQSPGVQAPHALRRPGAAEVNQLSMATNKEPVPDTVFNILDVSTKLFWEDGMGNMSVVQDKAPTRRPVVSVLDDIPGWKGVLVKETYLFQRPHSLRRRKCVLMNLPAYRCYCFPPKDKENEQFQGNLRTTGG
jgi:hypothetical protein